MPRPGSLRYLLLTLALLSGCAHSGPVTVEDPGSWRSSEGFGVARWGMTPDDLRPVLAGAVHPEESIYQVRDRVDDQPALVTYLFPYGHLSEVTVEVDTDAASTVEYDQAFGALVKRLGDPEPSPEVVAEREAAAAAVAAVVALVLVGILCAVATKGGGHGLAGAGLAAGAAAHAVPPVGVLRPAAPAAWFANDVFRLGLDAAEIAAIESSRPALPPEASGWLVRWKTRETEVTLVGSNLGYPGGRVVESFRSTTLSPTHGQANPPPHSPP